MVKHDNSKVLFVPDLLQTIQHFKTAVSLSDPVRFTSDDCYLLLLIEQLKPSDSEIPLIYCFCYKSRSVGSRRVVRWKSGKK